MKFIALDVECNMTPKQSLVQLSGMKYDYGIISYFNEYVLLPEDDDYDKLLQTKLGFISEEELKEKGNDLEVVIKDFHNFIKGFELYSYGNFDKKILLKNFNKFNLQSTEIETLIDFQSLKKIYSVGLKNLTVLNFGEFEGKEHDSLSDSINLGKLILSQDNLLIPEEVNNNNSKKNKVKLSGRNKLQKKSIKIKKIEKIIEPEIQELLLKYHSSEPEQKEILGKKISSLVEGYISDFFNFFGPKYSDFLENKTLEKAESLQALIYIKRSTIKTRREVMNFMTEIHENYGEVRKFFKDTFCVEN